MELSTTFMSYVLGGIGAIMYFSAPFFSDAKRAVQFRILAEILIGFMFLYQGHIAGLCYYGFLALSAIVEKQIESNRYFSLGYGIVACVVTALFNNNGVPGYVLAASLIVVFFHIDDQKMLATASYLDALTALIVLYYSISVRVWVGVIFAALLLLLGIAGLVSAVNLTRGGGLQAAAQEEAVYQKQHSAKTKKKRK